LVCELLGAACANVAPVVAGVFDNVVVVDVVAAVLVVVVGAVVVAAVFWYELQEGSSLGRSG
jgi:hypothetical protein